MRRNVVVGLLCGLLGSASVASAESILIDFENLSPGQVSSISESDPSLPSPVIFKTADNSPITITDLSSVSGATNFGSASISAASPILIEFPTAVSSVSLMAGHSDGVSYSLQLQAMGSDGMTVLGSDTEPLPAVGTFFNSTTLEVDQSGILSAEISGGGSGVFFDNVAITTGEMGVGVSAVPVPSTLITFPVGAALVGLALWHKRRRAAAM